MCATWYALRLRVNWPANQSALKKKLIKRVEYTKENIGKANDSTKNIEKQNKKITH